MKPDLKKIIEEIKESNMNESEITKSYILLIKNVICKSVENCKDEYSREEILADFLEEYNNELKFRGDAREIFYPTVQYEAIKRLLSNHKGNKNEFNKILKEARKRESLDAKEELNVKLNINECMIMVVRSILRKCPNVSEKDLINNLLDVKMKLSNDLKSKMITTIQECVAYLEEYGILDEYIKDSNENLEKLGLSELKLEKRNPIADEEYDGHGNLVKNKEEIGVIDSFETDILEKNTLEDLITMTAFWQSKYMEGRLGISRAMVVIDTLELWDKIIDEDENAIEQLADEDIIKVSKKDAALMYLCRNGVEITPKIKRQYKKFLEENGIKQNKEIKQEIEEMKPDITNLETTANDIAILQCLIMHLLQTKNMPVKSWGTITNSDSIEIPEHKNGQKGIVVAIENQNFRGPLLMEIPEEFLKSVLGNDLKFPEFKNTDKIDELYMNIMLRLYLPATEYYKEVIKKAYKENPYSELIANLAGKKRKEEPSGR